VRLRLRLHLQLRVKRDQLKYCRFSWAKMKAARAKRKRRPLSLNKFLRSSDFQLNPTQQA
jgi:cytochrome c biogenesis protein ResB